MQTSKRVFDIAFTLVFVVCASWVFVLISLAYIFTGNFPVFFYHPRVGKNEEIFNLIKFRTLHAGTKQTFALGNFLRATSLDELPQLFQVLSGKLSLIGPRPLPVEYLPLFTSEQRRRHSVRPGITGWAQVNGRNSISWPTKLSLDIYYIDHWSFMLDLRILIKTVIILFSFKKDVSLAEEPFKGEK